jgi:hypothetical protein
MGPTVQLRSRSAHALGAVMMAVSFLSVATAVGGGVDTVLRFAAPLALFGVLGWGAFWQPRVEVSDGGVLVVNTLRTVQVPWPAIESVDGRYGLRLVTAYGAVSAWGAAAPVGRQRARGEQSEAAVAVTERLEDLRRAGHLEGRGLERDALPTTWHLPLIGCLTLLAMATPVLPLLA